MYRQWVPCDCNFLYNFKPVFLKLCTFYPVSTEVHLVWTWFLNLFLSLFLTSDFMKVYRLAVLFEPNFSCFIWENVYAFDEIIISSTWKKHYLFGVCVCVCVGGGGGGMGVGGEMGEGCRCSINFTEVWSILHFQKLLIFFQQKYLWIR